MPTNKNYILYPSTEEMYHAYQAFCTIHENKFNREALSFEELNHDERLLFFYWGDIQMKLQESSSDSQVRLYNVLSELYERCTFKIMNTDDTNNKANNKKEVQ